MQKQMSKNSTTVEPFIFDRITLTNFNRFSQIIHGLVNLSSCSVTLNSKKKMNKSLKKISKSILFDDRDSIGPAALRGLLKGL